MPQVDQVTYLPIVFWVTITYNCTFVLMLYSSFLQLTNISQMEVKLLENKSLKNYYYKKLFLALIDSAFAKKLFLKNRFWTIEDSITIFPKVKKHVPRTKKTVEPRSLPIRNSTKINKRDFEQLKYVLAHIPAKKKKSISL